MITYFINHLEEIAVGPAAVDDGTTVGFWCPDSSTCSLVELGIDLPTLGFVDDCSTYWATCLPKYGNVTFICLFSIATETFGIRWQKGSNPYYPKYCIGIPHRTRGICLFYVLDQSVGRIKQLTDISTLRPHKKLKSTSWDDVTVLKIVGKEYSSYPRIQ